MDMGGYQLREQDRWLPIANVARLMKNTLPATAKVSKDAKECMQECVSEFISFITSEASDKCLMEKRKTINGEDILFSMNNLGFENYSEVLKIYLAKYRQQQVLKQERGEPRKKKKKYSKTSSKNNDGMDKPKTNGKNATKVKQEAKQNGLESEMNQDWRDIPHSDINNDNSIAGQNKSKSISQGSNKVEKDIVTQNAGIQDGKDEAHHPEEREKGVRSGIATGYVDQLYEQSYGTGGYAHNPNYHNSSYGGGVDLTRLPINAADEANSAVAGSKSSRVTSLAASSEQPNNNSQEMTSSHAIAADDSRTSAQYGRKAGDNDNSMSVPYNMAPHMKATTTATSNDAELSLNLNDNVASTVSETEELAGLTNGHHGENVLYRYQADF
ncbi:hypothetical protein HII12_001251 [Brettanomyces bruxellensis]|uniref:Transcription factor CBF/NF-Y/archaeal histone domain-containing protein n=1 Tax=Dekkera bruxellensis TaxID=5007 RepID=A0A8H6BNU0_DEKBR|nr:hypothetical protein HII12_001251 [Brettanomyces bruxellensis]